MQKTFNNLKNSNIGLIILAITLVYFPINSFSAEAIKFKYLQSIYFDEKGKGLKQPEGVACNGKTLLIVGDTGNDRLVRYEFREKDLRGGMEIRVPQLSSPIVVQINTKGEFFASDGGKRRIVRFSPEGNFKGYIDPEGLPPPSVFVPRSFKIDIDNNIYILDILSGRVLVLNFEGKYQKQIPFPQGYGFISDLCVDSKGNLFLIDCVNAVVYSSAKGSNKFSPLTKNLREYLNFPTGITTDKQGLIYIVDKNGGGIVILGHDGSFLSRQLSMGRSEGLLYYPTQICINEKSEVLIADQGNNRIQIFTLVR